MDDIFLAGSNIRSTYVTVRGEENYVIFWTKDDGVYAPNRLVLDQWDIRWPGEFVVMRAGESSRLTNMRAPVMELGVDAILQYAKTNVINAVDADNVTSRRFMDEYFGNVH